jgi:hypothetical protein
MSLKDTSVSAKNGLDSGLAVMPAPSMLHGDFHLHVPDPSIVACGGADPGDA